MNKKSFWLYVVIMTMAVIAVVLAIFILVVTDNKKPSNQHFKEEVSSQVTKVTESEEYQYVLKYERDTLRIYRNIVNEGREVFYDYADINMKEKHSCMIFCRHIAARKDIHLHG